MPIWTICPSALGETCYVDSVGGDDANTGISPDEPLRTQAAIGPNCSVARFRRGSRFDEKLALKGNVKVYTNYGERSDPLRLHQLRREE
jgi:hypothetical protein